MSNRFYRYLILFIFACGLAVWVVVGYLYFSSQGSRQNPFQSITINSTLGWENNCLNREGQVVGEGVCYVRNEPISQTNSAPSPISKDEDTGVITKINSDELELKTPENRLVYSLSSSTHFYLVIEQGVDIEGDEKALAFKEVDREVLKEGQRVKIVYEGGMMKEVWILDPSG